MKARFLAFAALMLGLASCQNEPEGINVIGGDEVSVVLNVTVPEDITRAGGTDSSKGAIGNINLENDYDVRFILEVYDADGALAKERITNYENTATSTAFDLRLVPGRDYKFVVWADFVRQMARTEGENYDLHYVTTNQGGLKDITVNADTWKAMDESRDAYTGIYDAVKFNSTQAINIELKRPFAKLRVVTTDIEDLYKVVPEDVKVTYNTHKLYTTFNAYTSKVVEDNAVANLAHEFKLSASEYSNDADGTQTLFADYMFGAENGTVKFTMDVVDTNGGIIPTIVFNTDIPVQRNYLTTINGPVLTDFNNIKVTINDAFENQENPEDLPHYIEIWDGKSVSEPKFDNTKNAYIIQKASELAWVAQQVNAGVTRSATANEFSGKKFLLEYDLNLNNEPWTPIGVPGYSNAFNGIIDGQGHKITNLCVTNTKGAGLIGGSEGCTIQNLTIDGVKLASNHYAGAFVAWGESGAANVTLTNCHVKNAVITVTPEEVDGKWDNGDKAGGIIGFAYAAIIDNCTADNVVVTAFRDVAGIAGYASKGSISNCTVTNSTITSDQTPEYNGEKDGNAGVIVGRIGDPVALNDNNEGENVVVIRKVDSEDEWKYAVADTESGDTIYVGAGSYSALANIKDNVTIIGVGNDYSFATNYNATRFYGLSKIAGSNVVVKNAEFRNGSGNTCLDQGLRGTIFENCNFNDSVAIYYAYAYGDVVFKDCILGYEGCTRGIHFDNKGGDYGTVTMTGCTIYGFTALGGGLDLVTFEKCNFAYGTKYNVSNMYGTKYVYNECTFNNEFHADCAGNNVVAEFNKCAYVDGRDITTVVRFDSTEYKNSANITFDGYKYVGEGVIEDEEGNLVVNSLQTLETALESAGEAGAGDTTIVFAENTTLDMTGTEWTPIEVDGYHGADIVTVEGNGSVIKGLTAPLFKGGFAGGSGIIIKDLTITESDIVSTNANGSGAFIETMDSMEEITLENCHFTKSTLSGSRTGGLIGWTSGYSNVNDGPVKTYVTIKDCSVIKVEINASSSAGGINGHAGASDWTYTTIENCTVKDCYIKSSDTGDWRTGIVLGTANAGEVTINNITASGNTIEQVGKTAPTGNVRRLYGRAVLNSTGKLVIDGYTYVADGYFEDANGNPFVGTQESLNKAIDNGATNVKLTAGNYTMPEPDLRGKTLTIVGTKDVVIDATAVAANDQFVTGANIVFDGVTINFGKTNYMGFANAESLTYKNCDINGLQFLYGPEVKFENCNLNSNGAEHTVWTYGAQKVSFTDCDFTYGDRGVNCYKDQDIEGGKQVVNFTNCTFATDNAASKGAVEINSSAFSIGIEVNLDGCTAPAYGELAYVSPWDSTNGAKTTITIK